MALRDNLISWWELNEESGTRVDAHGSNDLTDNNTVTFATGKQGNAADFEADNSEYLSITDASQTGLDITGDMTISTWAQVESAPAVGVTYVIQDKFTGSGDNRSYSVLYENNGGTPRIGLRISADGINNTIAWVNHDLGTGTLKYVTCLYDASAGSFSLYVDGSSIGTATGLPNSIYDSGAVFAIGATSAGTANWDGLMDEFGIWSRVLTSSEITELYNSGNGLSYADTEAAPTFTPRITIY